MNAAQLVLFCALTACSSGANDGVAAASLAPVPELAPALAPTPAAELAPAVEPGPAPVAARTQCAFSSLRKFEGRVVKWEGDCVDGKADGYGALRAYPRAGSEGEAIWIFFGKLRRGTAELGAFDLDGSFQAGRIVNGEMTGYDDRDLAIDALDVATKAATKVSERMKAAGNAASVAFYEKKAMSLALQLGD